MSKERIDLLEEDKPIAQQKFVCVSFVSQVFSIHFVFSVQIQSKHRIGDGRSCRVLQGGIV